MKRGDLIRHLEAMGCYLHREGANHSIFRNPTSRDGWSSVPRHSELQDRLVRKICKDLDIPAP